MTTISPIENTTYDMVTGSGNGLLTTSNTSGVDFGTPARTRAGVDTDFAFSISRARSPLGTLTFVQHVRATSSSKPKSYLVNWRKDLRVLPAILPHSLIEADPGAPAPIQGVSTIRTNEIYRIGRRETSLKKSWDKFGNTFEFHPNLFPIHNCPAFRLLYPSAMEIQLSVTEAIMSYSVMSNADELDLEAGDQDLAPTSAISRLSNSDDTETAEETTAITNQQEEIRNRLVKMHKCNKIVCTKSWLTGDA